jgi:transcription elongation factor Elf1
MNENISFTCPHCQHCYDDELELLDINLPHNFKCENCTQSFSILIKECLSCGAEAVFVSTISPILFDTQQHCAACGAPDQLSNELSPQSS